jgi:hypothetical protein
VPGWLACSGPERPALGGRRGHVQASGDERHGGVLAVVEMHRRGTLAGGDVLGFAPACVCGGRMRSGDEPCVRTVTAKILEGQKSLFSLKIQLKRGEIRMTACFARGQRL